MTHEVLIRPARITDAPTISAIQREARVRAMPWLPMVHTPEEDRVFFASRIREGETCMIAAVDGKDAGFICFEGDWVNHLYIHPDHWRGGLGARLLDVAKAAAPRLQLWTFQGNTSARAFYKAQGFEEAELTDGAGNEERTPDVRLIWARGQS